MIRCLVIPITCLLGCMLPNSALRAQAYRSVLIPSEVAQRYGLERAWFTQVRVDPGRGLISDIRLHVSGTRAQTIYEVVTDGGQKFAFSERHLDIFGKPMGVDGAAKAAGEKVRMLRLDGIEATTEEIVVPDITIYATTNLGMVHAIDGETGRTLWTTSVGRPGWPTSAAAVSEDLVAVVNNTSLFVLSADDGQVVWERRIGGAPASGAAIVGKIVYVPLLCGQIHAYSMAEDANWWAEVYRSNGTIWYQPTVAGNHVVWPNQRGEVTALQVGKPGVRFRVKLGDSIGGPIMYSVPDQLLCATQAGYLYALNAADGSVQWRFSTGSQTGESPAIVGGTVYVFSRWGGVQAISAITGERKWSAPSARQFVAATTKNVYVTTQAGDILILDANTGRLRANIATEVTDQLFVNNQTDRIYIGGRSGAIQCLRELGARWPTIHVPGVETAPDPVPAPTQKPAGGGNTPVDPFANPGGSTTTQPVNPFGPPADAKPTNPFGPPATTGPDSTPPAKQSDTKSDNPFD